MNEMLLPAVNKTPSRLRRSGLLLLSGVLLLGSTRVSAAAGSALEEGFKNPPASSSPHTYWYWMDGMVTKEGITHDLESMSKIGVGGANIGHIMLSQAGPVKTMSEEWWGMMEHAVKEGARLGVEIGAFNSPGWSSSGGPWIKPEHAMQELVWTATPVKGGAKFSGILPAVDSPLGAYRDVAVLAFPKPAGTDDTLTELSPAVKLSNGQPGNMALLDDNLLTSIDLPASSKAKPQWIAFETKEPLTARSMTLAASWKNYAVGQLQSSEDGVTYKKVADFFVNSNRTVAAPRSGEPAVLTVRFKPATARYWRLWVERSGEAVSIAQFDLSAGALVDQYQTKSLKFLDRTPFNTISWPTSVPLDDLALGVAKNSIVDLTASLKSDGSLNWDAPPGDWVIHRYGMIPLARYNHPTGNEGRGLESDKLNPAAVEENYRGMMGPWVKRVGSLAGKSLTFTTIDSFEAGSQNWSPVLVEEFTKRRGYNPIPWLPVMSGQVVESADISDRFLWDMRRTLADLVADVSVGHLRELANKDGLKLWIETDGPGQFFESLQYGGRSDEVAGEFWNGSKPPSTQTKVAASSAHIYGKKIVGTESFTAGSKDDTWKKHPAELKAMGDATFTGGANRLTLHVWAHQPYPQAKPGQSVGAIGTHFSSHTWWSEAKAWLDYIKRCQFLLQEGQSVIDLAYFIGEGVPRVQGEMNPATKAHHFDWMNREGILKFKVKDGVLTLPHGMTYRALVLSRETTMTPEIIEKVKELINDGALVIGNVKPEASPSLTGYPASNAKVVSIANELWGKEPLAEKSPEKVRQIGKGKLASGVSDIDGFLKKSGLTPDVSREVDPGVGTWMFYHKKLDDREFYFVSNQKDVPETATYRFRITGHIPALWNPLTGEVANNVPFVEKEGATELNLHLDPSGSMVVMFTKRDQAAAGAKQLESIRFKGQPFTSNLVIGKPLLADANGTYLLRYANGTEKQQVVNGLPSSQTVDSPWTVQFPALPVLGHPKAPDTTITLAKLASWTTHADPEVKYYSGTAVYENTIAVNAAQLAKGTGRVALLDLGDVEVMARVEVNGKTYQTLWKPPYQVDITAALVEGDNKIKVHVTNLLVNRLIGDEALYPDDVERLKGSPKSLATWPDWLKSGAPRPTQRKTLAATKQYTKGDPLLPSGLIGPVRVKWAESLQP
jgi:hypothetical protein